MKTNIHGEEVSTPVLDLRLILEGGEREWVTARIFTQTDDRVEIHSSHHDHDMTFSSGLRIVLKSDGDKKTFAYTTLRTIGDEMRWGLTLDTVDPNRQLFLSSIRERCESIFRFEMLVYLAHRLAFQPEKSFDLEASTPFIERTVGIKIEELHELVNFMKG